MLRYAALMVLSLVAGNAWAQTPPPAAAPPPAAPAVSSPPKAVIRMEDPQPGDYWTYEGRDEITGKISDTRENVVTEVTPKEISVRAKNVGTPNGTLNIYDRSWNVLITGPWKCSPSDGSFGIQPPLTVGKSWAFQSNNVNSSDGNIVKRSGTSKVVGQETMTTKAGTFETFKIETSYSTRSVKNPTQLGEVTFQTWYAPAIDHWVKRISVVKMNKHLTEKNTFELIEYGRKQ
jgi:hypothetical protein